MNFEPLKKHIFDTVKEWQLKIGYRPEDMKLYYPDVSLKELLVLEDQAGEEELEKALTAFSLAMAPTLGAIQISHKGERYCLTIPPEGSAFVHEHVPDSPFLKDFIQTITTPGETLDGIRSCFHRHEDAMHPVEEADLTASGLGHVFFFPSGEPDDYVYCIESDDFGLTYHRFTREDYEKLL